MISHYRTYALPWDLGLEEDQRLRGFLKKSAIAAMALTVIFSFLPLPEAADDEVKEVPPRFAKLLLDKPKPTPPPPPPVVKAEAEPVKPEPVEKKVEKVVEKKPEPKPVIDRTVEARKKVAGLLPFADDLADLRDNKAVAAVKNNRQLAGAAGEATRSERSLISSKAGRASGGINTASMSRDTGGAGLAGRDTTAVSSTVAGLQSSGPAAERSGDSDRPSRSREEIEIGLRPEQGRYLLALQPCPAS